MHQFEYVYFYGTFILFLLGSTLFYSPVPRVHAMYLLYNYNNWVITKY